LISAAAERDSSRGHREPKTSRERGFDSERRAGVGGQFYTRAKDESRL
jgi:hypothetical protein